MQDRVAKSLHCLMPALPRRNDNPAWERRLRDSTAGRSTSLRSLAVLAAYFFLLLCCVLRSSSA